MPPQLNIEILQRKSLFIRTEFTLFYSSLKKQSIILLLSFTHLLALVCQLHFLLMFNSYLIEATQIWWLWRRRKHQTKFWEFIYEEILAYRFNNFVCITGLCTIILKFVQISWPDVHNNNSEECFYHVLTSLTYCIKAPCSYKSPSINKTWLNISTWWFQWKLLRKISRNELRSCIKQRICL